MTYTEDQVRQMIRDHVKTKYRFQKVAAWHWNVRPQFVSCVLTSRAKPTKAMLIDIGVVKVVTTTTEYKDQPSEQEV